MNKLTLIYDGDCPICGYYCRRLHIEESIGHLKLIDARVNYNQAKVILSQYEKVDLNKGFVLIIDQQLYWGDKAIHALASISSRSNMFNRINYYLFKSKFFAKYSYPVLVTLRFLLLKLLGKKPL
jgi:predicted DCC family thiol-disulfide oxidoreductase YuxK